MVDDNNTPKQHFFTGMYRNPYLNDLGSSMTLIGGGIGLAYYAHALDSRFIENLRYSVNHMRHAGNTVTDAVRGGPEGYLSVKNLEDALTIVEAAADGNAVARTTLEGYMGERQAFAEELVDVYRENETVSQVASRLQIQLEGSLRNFYEVGNAMKNETWQRIDDFIIRIYGMDPLEARERSERLNEFYQEVSDFYDAREHNEHTISEFCDYLVRVQETSETQNKDLAALFPELIAHVREGYETEDFLFDTRHDGVSVSELEDTVGRVDTFGEQVQETYESVGVVAPIAPYNPHTLADYLVNPVTIGVAVGLGLKGVLSFFPQVIKRPLNNVLATPFLVTARGLHRGGQYSLRKISERKKITPESESTSDTPQHK